MLTDELELETAIDDLSGLALDKQLLDALPIFAAILKPSGEILRCNFPTLAIPNKPFAKDPDFLLGRHISSLHYWRYDKAIVDNIRQWVKECAEGKTIVTDVFYRRLTGESGTLEFRLRPHLDVDRVSTGMLLCTCADVTTFRSTQRQLNATEERFQKLTDGLPQMVWMQNVLAMQVFANKAYCEFFGITEEEAVGDDWRTSIHPEDSALCLQFNSAVENRVGFNQQIRVRNGRGQWRNLELTGTPSYTHAGEFVGYLGTGVDITERLKVERVLADSDQRKDEFLATLGHELRNPLAPILSSIELIKQVGSHNQQVDGAIEIMQRQASQLMLLIEDLMDASRVSQGIFDLHLSPVHLGEVVKNAIQTAMPLIEKAEHNLAIIIPRESVRVNVDPLRISQVITNLLNNAGKFTPAGGQLSIEMKVLPTGYDIIVKDNGRGFAPDTIDQVFGMYTQLDKRPSNGETGLGVGLALSRDLVERHDGVISVSSHGLGKGSCFVVSLPSSIRCTSDLPGHPQTETGHPQTETTWVPDNFNTNSGESALSNDRQSPLVLVVDDNKDAAFVLSQLLQHLGASTHIANDGASAMKLLESMQPDLIILDIGLPDVSGLEVARQIRKLPWGAQVKLIAVSGLSHEDDVAASMAAGIDEHKVKPVSLVHLKPLMESLSNSG